MGIEDDAIAVGGVANFLFQAPDVNQIEFCNAQAAVFQSIPYYYIFARSFPPCQLAPAATPSRGV
jgi:hypothetical protein